MIEILLALLIGYIVGRTDGWHRAHECVAKECERLGAFFVGNKTFKCTEIIENKKTT
jgi:hypothetical protein